MRSKPWLKHTKAFLFYICDKRAKTMVKDSPLMGKNLIRTKLTQYLTHAMNRGDENEPLI